MKIKIEWLTPIRRLNHVLYMLFIFLFVSVVLLNKMNVREIFIFIFIRNRFVFTAAVQVILF